MAAVGGIIPWVACSARSTGKSDLDVELPWWRWGDGVPPSPFASSHRGGSRCWEGRNLPGKCFWILGNKRLGCDAEAAMMAGEAVGGHTRRHRPTKGFATRRRGRVVQG